MTNCGERTYFAMSKNVSKNMSKNVKKKEYTVNGPACEEDEQTERGNWDQSWEFVFFLISYAVGLGNFWRFPVLCMRNGGGAFLIPYFTFMLVCGVPIFYLELILGQFSSLSALEVWKICPILKGLGWGMVIVSAYCTIYFNVIISWVLYYLGSSFSKDLPWAECGHHWNTENCYKRHANDSTGNSSLSMEEHDGGKQDNDSMQDVGRIASPAEEFWDLNVLQRSSGIEEFGGIRFELFGLLALSWVVVFFCLIKGIKSSGKVVYVTATLPYCFLIALLIRGSLLPGSLDGVKFYIYPDFSRLLQLGTWCEACLQIFFSLGLSWGTMITMASYNKFNHNCLRDAIIVPIVSCGTSFFAGFVIFSIMGFMAHDAGIKVEDVVNSGPGLAFITYPAALARMPFSVGWSIAFFVMLFFVGLGTQFGMVETVISGIVDCYPSTRRWKPAITAAYCVLGLLCGLPFVSKAGVYHFQIWDWYSAAFSVSLIAFFEVSVVAWVYGWRRLSEDIDLMLGHKPSIVWRILWCFVVPALLLTVIIYSCINLAEPIYGDYKYPYWAILMGWILAVTVVMPIPVLAAREVWRQQGTIMQRLVKTLQPTADWGPSLKKHRAIYDKSYDSTDMGIQTSGDREQTAALSLEYV